MSFLWSFVLLLPFSLSLVPSPCGIADGEIRVWRSPPSTADVSPQHTLSRPRADWRRSRPLRQPLSLAAVFRASLSPVCQLAPDGSDRVSDDVRRLLNLVDAKPGFLAAVRKYEAELDWADANSADVCRAVLGMCFAAGLLAECRIEAVPASCAVFFRTDDAQECGEIAQGVPGMPDLCFAWGRECAKIAYPVLSERARRSHPPFLPAADEDVTEAAAQIATFALETAIARPLLARLVVPEDTPPAGVTFRSPCISCGARKVELRSLILWTAGGKGRLVTSICATSAPLCHARRCAVRGPRTLQAARDALFGPGSEAVLRCGSCKVAKLPSELKRCARCKGAWYCSAECQRSDWPSHKLRCAQATVGGSGWA